MNENELMNIITMTATEFSRWMMVTIGPNIEIRESDYNRYKMFMRTVKSMSSDKAIKYKNTMEKLFSNMKIEHDFIFGNIYISSRYDFNNALNELVKLEMEG